TRLRARVRCRDGESCRLSSDRGHARIRLEGGAHRAVGVMETGAGRAGRDAEDLGDLDRFEPGEGERHENGALLWVESAEAALQLIAVGDGEELVRAGRKIGREHM